MNQKIGPYHIVDLAVSRRETPNLLDVYWWKHSVYALLEVDVTIATRRDASEKIQGCPRQTVYQQRPHLRRPQRHRRRGHQGVLFE